MSGALSVYPAFPPGFWRRIELHPAAGAIVGGLEDDVHRFMLTLEHDGERITSVPARTERVPWSVCPGAGPFLQDGLTGRALDEVARLDPKIHCTHLFELAVLCAAHAHLAEPVRYDIKVGDPVNGRARAVLAVNGEQAIIWEVSGTALEGPAEWAGRDLRRLSQWGAQLDPDLALKAMMLRRAIMVSGARRQPQLMREGQPSLDPRRLGACFRYQLPQATDAQQTPDWRKDFSRSRAGPLQDFPPRQDTTMPETMT
jgi:hypothetical protein